MINFLQNLSLAQPYFLGLLLLQPLLYWYFFKKKKIINTLKMNNLQGIQQWQSPKQRYQKWLFPLLSMLFFTSMTIALTRPQQALKAAVVNQKGIDIMLVLDLSMSMLAKDFKPNRLEASKNVAINFIQKRPYDRIGLVTFSGEAFTQCPLTTDHEVLMQMISTVKTGQLADGTAIGMGLATAVNRLKESKAKSKIVILLTDGVNNAGYIAPQTAADLAKELGIKIYTIGVGTVGQAMMPIGRRLDGEIVFDLQQVEIDEALLQQLALTTPNGSYFRAKDLKELEGIYEQIDVLEKTVIESSVFKEKEELFRPFVLFALLILVLSFVLKNTYFRTLP
jgi:Ca-activated chloride channel homolog